MTVDREAWAGRLAELAGAASVPGAVLGVWADGQQTVTPYGVLSTRTGVETTADSVFQIGSITKTWTATMVVQLVEEGRLTYDTPVAELLPGVRLGRDDASATITVRHLLTHSSGLDGDLFDDTGRGDEAVERYVALLAEVDRAFKPGAAYSYCNSGFVVLGRIVEVLDGRTWDASLRSRLVRPPRHRRRRRDDRSARSRRQRRPVRGSLRPGGAVVARHVRDTARRAGPALLLRTGGSPRHLSRPAVSAPTWHRSMIHLPPPEEGHDQRGFVLVSTGDTTRLSALMAMAPVVNGDVAEYPAEISSRVP